MKLKNSPARKLRRQIVAKEGNGSQYSEVNELKLQTAREVRNKKYRGAK